MGGARSTHEGDEKSYETLVGKSEGQIPLGRPDVDGKIILKLRKYVGKVRTGLIWLRTGVGGGLL
jgi:hypothetical protein